MNGIPIQTIKLSTGELYTPERGKPPIRPCYSCLPEKRLKCMESLSVCDEYMDYEHANAIYRTTVFGSLTECQVKRFATAEKKEG